MITYIVIPKEEKGTKFEIRAGHVTLDANYCVFFTDENLGTPLGILRMDSILAVYKKECLQFID